MSFNSYIKQVYVQVKHRVLNKILLKHNKKTPFFALW